MINNATILTSLFIKMGDAIKIGGPCTGDVSSGSFLGFPTWYEYLSKVSDQNGKCVPAFVHLSDVWLIVAAVIDILLRVASLIAVVMIILAGVSYITSQGEPDKVQKAKGTLINALIGLGVAVTASVTITFIARSIS